MKRSAGIVCYRVRHQVEFLLVHPGGPFWKNRDTGSWTIPKGEIDEGEDPLASALREFEEETGHKLNGIPLPLEPVVQKGGKQIQAWAVADPGIDAGNVRSNYFELEWPRGSGKKKTFPEIDKAAWLGIEEAREKVNPAQVALLEQVLAIMNS